MEILQLLETIRAEEASAQRLLGSDKRDRRRARSAEYLSKLAEVGNFYADVVEGRLPFRRIKEAMSTSDFPQLFGDVIDRQMIGYYDETPSSWQMAAKRASVRDFRTVSRKRLDGGTGDLDQVPESDEYPEASVTDSENTYSVKKFGRVLPFTWEAEINDDLDAFAQIPERLGRAARYSEERFFTELIVDASGPLASVYSAGNANIVTGNPALSIAGLQTAYTVLGKQTDSEGQPIFVDAVTLLVPPALEVTARNILNAIEIRALTGGGGTAEQGLVAMNWMKNKLSLAVNYQLPVVITNAEEDTAWFLFGSPSSPRPAVEMGFLQGHEQPELFVKRSLAERVAGGGADMASFDNDTWAYKLRHVYGGTVIDPKLTVASEGDGT